MPRTSSVFLHFLTCCLLIGLTYAIYGKRVKDARPNKFPFIVSIARRSVSKDFQNLHFCTGTLVQEKKIVTAAHCLVQKEPDDVEIIAGSVKLNEGRKYYPDSWIEFDQWNQHHAHKNLPLSDIAVIKLKGDGIRGITPVKLLLVDNIHQDQRGITIAGWGESSKGTKVINMRRALLTVLSTNECNARGSFLKGKKFSVPPNYICSAAKPYVLSTCGDGGAPILNKEEKLVAINRGTCPNLEGYLYNTAFLKHNHMNAHLKIYNYIDFILHA